MLGMIKDRSIGKMAVEQLNRFNLGFISPYDVDTEKAPSNALADCLNIEINDPLVGIRGTPTSEVRNYGNGMGGHDGTGAQIVAFKKFMVNYPEKKEITLLVKRSENLLRFSEDFEIPYNDTTGFSGWEHDSGLTVTPNCTLAPGSPPGSRRADQLTGSNGVKILQRFSEALFATGKTFTFSVYMQATSYNTNPVKIRIRDNGGYTETNCVPISGYWSRHQVTRTIENEIGYAQVEIEFTSSRSVYVWGAQVVEGTEAAAYGYTTVYIRPYYFFIKPYKINPDDEWIDEWLELNEMRSGIVEGWGGGNSEQFSISSDDTGLSYIDGGENYYKNWAIVNAHDFSDGSMITKYHVDVPQSIRTFYVGPTKFLANGKPVVLCRSAAMFSKFYVNSDWAVEDPFHVENKDFWFTQIGDDIRINLSEDYAPLYIGWRKAPQLGFQGVNDSRRPDFKGFFLSIRDLENHLTAWQYRKMASLQYSIGSNDSGGNLKPSTKYRLWMVGLFDGNQEAILGYDDIELNATHNALTPRLDIYPALLTPRLTSIKIYIHEGDDTDFDKTYYLYTSTNSNWTIANGTYYYRLVFPIVTDIDTTQSVLSEEFTYYPLIDIKPRYRMELYLNGRSYIVSRANPLVVRFSSIRTIVSEPDVFPFSLSEGYGCFVVGDAGGEEITALCPLGRDLMIFTDKRTYTYMVTSIPHQLLTVFYGIGCYSSQVMAYNTDYGIFWCDENDIYWYMGGTEPPKRISAQKITQYWRKVLSKYLSTAFAVYFKKLNEYWIFIQASGDLGSTSYEDYKVFRYSIENDNFNILQFPYLVLGATFNEDGTIALQTDSLEDWRKWGSRTTTSGSDAYFTTHKLTFGTTYTDKLLKEVGVEYDFEGIFYIELFINDETDPRVTLTFTDDKPANVRRGVRQGLIFRKIAVKCIKEYGDSKFIIKEINLNYFQRKRRLGAA